MNAATIRRDAPEHDETKVSRGFRIERLKEKADDESEVTVYRVSLSSESPIKDWPWAPPNILVHDKSAVDLSGISERGLPLFVNHRAREIGSLIGRIVNVRLKEKRLIGDLRFSEANPDAAMVRGMVDEGTLTDMSISAEPLKIQRTEGADGQTESVKWLRWRPMEASVVGIGADQSVGIGRSVEVVHQSADAEGVNMTDEEKAAAEQKQKLERDAAARIEAGKQQNDTEFAARAEQERIDTIRKLGTANQIGEDTVQAWIGRGTSFDKIADDILAIQKKRGEKGNQSLSALDLTERETKQYSLSRAILAARDENWKDAGFEHECHEAIATKLNRIPERGHFFVPQEVQRRPMNVDLERLARAYGLPHLLQRDLNTALGSAGGYLVQTSVAGFDELLRNISVLMRMGATTLPGLRDNVTIPRQSAAATAEWLGTESASATESQQTFVQLALTPKTVSARTEVSRKLLMQSSIAIEGLVTSDLAAVCSLAADLAGLSGTGAGGQPLGLDNVTGVGTVTGTSLAFEDILEFQTDVAAGNVMPDRGGYVTTPSVASLMIQRVKYTNTGTPLWEGNIWRGTMQGFPAMSSNQVASAVMYFGDWSKIVIAEWGTLEIDTNPYGTGFGAGIIEIRALYSMDIGVRLPVAFSRASSIT